MPALAIHCQFIVNSFIYSCKHAFIHTNKDAGTALVWACRNGDAAMAKVLIEHGADIIAHKDKVSLSLLLHSAISDLSA